MRSKTEKSPKNAPLATKGKPFATIPEEDESSSTQSNIRNSNFSEEEEGSQSPTTAARMLQFTKLKNHINTKGTAGKSVVNDLKKQKNEMMLLRMQNFGKHGIKNNEIQDLINRDDFVKLTFNISPNQSVNNEAEEIRRIIADRTKKWNARKLDAKSDIQS